MVSREEFNKYLSELISEKEIEHINRSVMTKTILSVAFLIASIICVFIALTMGSNGLVLILIAIFLAITSLVIILMRKSGAYAKLETKYKSQVLDFLMQGTPYEYAKEGRVPVQIFRDSMLARSFDNYEGEDLLMLNVPNDDGSMSKTHLIISDVYATERVYNDDKEEWETKVRYQGVLGYIEFPAYFKCRLTLNRNNYAYLKGMDKVQLESIDFNKKFSIRTNDQIEARYILTPDMMQKLIDLQEKEKNIEMVLDENIMYISIPGKNLFTLSTAKKRVDGEAFYRMYDDIAVIFSIIDEIKNNDKIFKM